jgi:hypothetical protein
MTDDDINGMNVNDIPFLYIEGSQVNPEMLNNVPEAPDEERANRTGDDIPVFVLKRANYFWNCTRCGKYYETFCSECEEENSGLRKRIEELDKIIKEMDEKVTALWYSPGNPGSVEALVDFEEKKENS